MEALRERERGVRGGEGRSQTEKIVHVLCAVTSRFPSPTSKYSAVHGRSYDWQIAG